MPFQTPILPAPVPASKHLQLTVHPTYIRGRRQFRRLEVAAITTAVLAFAVLTTVFIMAVTL